MKILVVEDDESLSRVLEKSLQRFHYEVVCARNGREGLELYRTAKPDLIISDIDMPVMGGLELLDAIRAEDDDVIIIMATGYGCEEYAIRALHSKANTYLKKPIELQDLWMLLNKYAESIKGQSEAVEIEESIVNRTLCMSLSNEMSNADRAAVRLANEVKPFFSRSDILGLRLGLFEILVNAMEHGNLGITQEEKNSVLEEDLEQINSLYEERMKNPEYADRKVTIDFAMEQLFCEWTISDQGKGFNVENYPKGTDEESGLPTSTGHGIFLARLQFDEFEYLGCGNTVRLRKYLTKP